METKIIKEKLNSKDYDFLRTTEGLKDHIILLTTGGSVAYGTDTPESDLDIRGIALNSRKELLTMRYREKPYEDEKTDTIIYTLKQITRLLSNANPNVLEILGTKEEHLFVLTKEGQLLRENADLFLSKRVIYSFGGYAASQLRRLQNAMARDEDYSQREKEQHILNTLLHQMAGFEERYRKFAKDSIKLYLDKSDKDCFEEEIFIDISLSHYPLRDLKNMVSEMNNIIRDYDKLNSRNHKKDEAHLNKHAMHLVRLLIMGTEILEGKGINTYREHDREFLIKIRNGDFVIRRNGVSDYSLFFEIVDECEKRFQYAAANTSLPDIPDEDKIDELIAAINWSTLNKEY